MAEEIDPDKYYLSRTATGIVLLPKRIEEADEPMEELKSKKGHPKSVKLLWIVGLILFLLALLLLAPPPLGKDYIGIFS